MTDEDRKEESSAEPTGVLDTPEKVAEEAKGGQVQPKSVAPRKGILRYAWWNNHR